MTVRNVIIIASALTVLSVLTACGRAVGEADGGTGGAGEDQTAGSIQERLDGQADEGITGQTGGHMDELTEGQTVYTYADTQVYYDGFQIIKTVYAPGEMKLYYSGAEELKDNKIRCYGADFEDLGDDFTHTFDGSVMTVKSQFAEKISGIKIDDADSGLIYHLRYLDSGQFAWMAEELWLDEGWTRVGDRERYYSADELRAQEKEADKKRQETLDAFTLLEGTWLSDDGESKWTFAIADGGEHLKAAMLWYDPESKGWLDEQMSVEAAYQSPYLDDEGEETDSIEMLLVNASHSLPDLTVVYDPDGPAMRVDDEVYHR